MKNRTKSLTKDVLVLLPAHNEELTISSTVHQIRKYRPDVEIILIDNASVDSTPQVAKSLGLTVLNEPRRGKGFAVQRGFDYASSKDCLAVALMDADATYGAEKLIDALDLVLTNMADMVVGSRVATEQKSIDSATLAHYRFGHQIGNRFFSWVGRVLLPSGIEDVLSGWRVMSRAFVSSFPGGSRGFEIEAQLNSHAYELNSAVANIPVAYYSRPKGSNSKLNTYSDGWRILRTTLKNFRRNRPLLAFSILSLPWLLTTFWLMYLPFKTYLETGLVPYLPRLVAGIGTFLIASLLWVSGMLLERIREIRIQLILGKYHALKGS